MESIEGTGMSIGGEIQKQGQPGEVSTGRVYEEEGWKGEECVVGEAFVDCSCERKESLRTIGNGQGSC
jgi:hypothetical protein